MSLLALPRVGQSFAPLPTVSAIDFVANRILSLETVHRIGDSCVLPVDALQEAANCALENSELLVAHHFLAHKSVDVAQRLLVLEGLVGHAC